MITAIVAADNNWGIGYQGSLLAKIPEDMKRFKDITTGGTVIMGRQTYDSLPKKPLPNRRNIIISHRYHGLIKIDENVYGADLDNIIQLLEEVENDNMFVIGGGQIYSALLPWCDKVVVTRIMNSFTDVDTYFPNLDMLSNWKIIETSDIHEYENTQYVFITYMKIFY